MDVEFSFSVEDEVIGGAEIGGGAEREDCPLGSEARSVAEEGRGGPPVSTLSPGLGRGGPALWGAELGVRCFVAGADCGEARLTLLGLEAGGKNCCVGGGRLGSCVFDWERVNVGIGSG